VVVSSTHGVTLGYAGGPPAAPQFATQPATRTALTAAGAVTQVSLFNPSSETAHATVSLVGRAGVRVVTRAIRPSGVFTVRARASADPPRGVVVSSDVPLVTATGA
jgi:hypothetical protein